MAASPVGVEIAVEMPGIPARSTLRDWAVESLEAAGAQGALAIRVVDESESAALNMQWRHKTGPTNVLSFPAAALPPDVPLRMLGDVVICAPVVAREAAMQGKSQDAHWAHMVIHGVLHLLGHDHDDPVDARRMESLETRLLARLGYPDPYEQD